MSRFTIGEDLRGVLEDVAKSKKQQLFAGNYFNKLHTAFDAKVETVGVAMPGLSSAERELITMHRRELSMCLLHGFYAHFFAEPHGVNPIVATAEISTFESRKENAHFARDFAPTESFRDGTTLWLHRLLENEPITRYKDFLSLAAAATRLDDSPFGTLYQGYAHYTYGNMRAAKSRLSHLVKSTPLALRIPALRTLQSVMFELDQDEGALGVSFGIIGITSRLGMQEELVSELGRLAANRLAKPELRLQALPPKVVGLARELWKELRIESQNAPDYAPDSILCSRLGVRQELDLVGALLDSNS